ncbi:MAG: adenylosuccinate lyase [Nanoarchaeota archaeon]
MTRDDANLDVLSRRYASPQMNEIFSDRNRVRQERVFWVRVMQQQRKLGMSIPVSAIRRFERAVTRIDLARIDAIDMRIKHDLKARIEAFVEEAKAEQHIHKALTSRDVTDNVDLILMRSAAVLVISKFSAVLTALVSAADRYRSVMVMARTHRQPAQVTLLGRRFAMWAEELLLHLESFDAFIASMPFRGIKGATGTQADMLALLGSKAKVARLESALAKSFGFDRVLASPGQVYPRSLDAAMLSHLSLMGAACEDFAKGVRLMAGDGIMSEGFATDQVGSSAMPHKMNTRSAERVCGFSSLLKMYADGASRISGDQWDEGDVSCSVVRRVIVPGAFYAADAMCDTVLFVLARMEVYSGVARVQIDRDAAFLASSLMLAAAVDAGVGREDAHDIVRRHAVAEAKRIRREGGPDRLVELIASEKAFSSRGLDARTLKAIVSDVDSMVGLAREHIDEVARRASRFKVKKSPLRDII